MTAWAGITGLFAATSVLLLVPLLRGRISRGGMIVSIVVCSCLALALVAYGRAGAPAQASTPAMPQPVLAADMTEHEAARAALLQNPADILGWLKLSDSLIRMNRTAEASEAVSVALSVMPGSPDLWIAQGEALVAHGGGLVTPAARLAFDRASALAPQHPAPRYYLGMAWMQAGKPRLALAEWDKVVALSRPGAPWLADVRRKMDAARTMTGAGVGSGMAAPTAPVGR